MKKIGLIIVLIAVILLFIPYVTFIQKDLGVSLFRVLVWPYPVKKIDTQVNIALLGIPGGLHDGPNLSDSITVFNYDLKENRAVSMGIPRDIWSTSLRDRINSAYAYGEAKTPGGGLKLAKAEIGSIIGIPIQYAVVIDFAKFEQLIDDFGGVDIVVEKSFVDNKYPIEGKEADECGGDTEFKCRYETLRFEKGEQHMDGKTALKFVRSRNAEGSEGSDFARNLRQQKVMDSVKDAILSEFKSFNIVRIRKAYRMLDELIIRDITNKEASTIAKKIVFGKRFSQASATLSRELFEVPDAWNYDGKYVLVPISEEKVRDFVLCTFNNKSKCL